MSIDPAVARGLLRDLKTEALDPIALYRQGEAARTSWRSKLQSVFTHALGAESHLTKAVIDVRYSLFIFTDATPDTAWEDAFADGVARVVGLMDAAELELQILESVPVGSDPGVPATAPPNRSRTASGVSGGETSVARHRADANRTGGLELFHRVNNLLPEGQELMTVPANMTAGDALGIMLENNYSQVPVVEGTTFLGSFSYRSFSRGLLDIRRERVDPLALPVDDFVEKLTIVNPTDDFDSILAGLNADGAVLVGRPDRLAGLVTGADALSYLYRLAELFVQIQESEQAVRALISISASEAELVDCIRRSLVGLYAGREDKMPTSVIEMSFSEYASVIGDGRNWPLFEAFLGSDRTRVKARLDLLGELRNDVFHFRRELNPEDQRHVRTTRDWLLRRLQLADIRTQTDE